jgi:hypothetical protein
VAGDLTGAIRRAAQGALAAAGWDAPQLAALAFVGGPAEPWQRAERDAVAGMLAAPGGEDRHAIRWPARLETQRQLGHALAAAGPIDGALLLARLSELPPGQGESAARGLALAVGSLGQCAALALAGPEAAG